MDLRDEFVDDARHGNAYGHVLVAGRSSVCLGFVHGSLVGAHNHASRARAPALVVSSRLRVCQMDIGHMTAEELRAIATRNLSECCDEFRVLR